MAAAPGAPPAPAAKSLASQAPAGNWAAELPTTVAVKQAIQGTSTADTAARQEAAFATLCDYIETRNGGMFKPMAPAVQKTFLAYSAEASKTHPNMPRSVSPAASVYFDSLAFREQTVSKLINKPAFDYYAATSSNVAELRAQAPVRAKQAAMKQEGSDWQRRVQPDVAKAKKEHSTLLGVAMGVPLSVPTCAGLGVDPTAVKGGQMLNGVGLGAFSEMMGADPKATANAASKAVGCYSVFNDGTESITWLQTPAWVVSAESIVKGGVLLGGRIIAREDDALFKQLARKYGSPTSTEKVNFQNAYGARSERTSAEWRLPGVYVKYAPRGGDMQMPVGDLLVELDTVHQLSVKAEAEKEEQGPQL